MKITFADGRVEWRGLANDDASIEIFVRERATPYTLDELRQPFRAGRPQPSEAARRAHIANLVAEALEAGARSTALARIFGLASAAKVLLDEFFAQHPEQARPRYEKPRTKVRRRS